MAETHIYQNCGYIAYYNKLHVMEWGEKRKSVLLMHCAQKNIADNSIWKILIEPCFCTFAINREIQF